MPLVAKRSHLIPQFPELVTLILSYETFHGAYIPGITK
jgi:hypothetical protein